MEGYRLTDLIDIEILQKLQDSFSDFTRMAAIVTDENGVPLTRPSGFCRFCNELVRATEEGRRRCEQCDIQGAMNSLQTGRPVVYRCHAGLVDYSSPIVLDGQVLGAFVGGQVRPEEIDRGKKERDARDLGIDPEEYIAAAEQTVVIPFHQVEAAAKFLAATTKAISDLAYHNAMALKKSKHLEKAARSQSNFIMNMSMDMEKQLNGWMNSARDALMGGEGAEDAMMRILGESASVCAQMSDTVEFIRLTGGEVSLTEMIYDPRALIRQVVEKTKPAMAEKSISLTVETDGSVPQYLLGAAGLLGQMLHKLILSGARYTFQGGVTVRASCTKGSYATLLQLEIENTDGGMTPQTLETFRGLFQNSYLVDRAGIVDDVEGLSIPAIGAMVKQLSGSVDIDSIQGRGTVVRLTVPQLEVRG